MCTYPRTITHTHPFNGPFSGTTSVGRYQKGKTNLDFTEARDSGISWAICKSAPRSRQITTPAPHHSVFLQAGCPSCRPTNSVKALKAIIVMQLGCVLWSRRVWTEANDVNKRRDKSLHHGNRVAVEQKFKSRYQHNRLIWRNAELTSRPQNHYWLTDWMSLLWRLTNRRRN